MIRKLAYPSEKTEEFLRRFAERGVRVDESIETDVRNIIENVRRHGDSAIVEYTRALDSPSFTREMIVVGESEIDHAYKEMLSKEPDFVEVIRKAADNIRVFHEAQREKSWFINREEEIFLGQIVRPVDAVGAYIPGGTGGNTPLISTLLMTVIPARVAGVPHISIASPPRRDGSLHPGILAAAKECGVSRIYRMGSAWAISAFAWGTETVNPVNVIVGPGNIYVVTAKRLVSGHVGVDIIAGPSEVLIIADETAVPAFSAADLLSQAEHDTYASAMLITWNNEVAESIIREVERQIEGLPRKNIAAQSLQNYGACFMVKDKEDAMELAHRIAPEHLELHVEKPWEWLGKIRNAGAVFLGHYTPEPLGDYFAGPNHVLPTSQTARFASALNIGTFLKRISVLYYTKRAFLESGPKVEKMAQWEGLDAHAQSVIIRMKNG